MSLALSLGISLFMLEITQVPTIRFTVMAWVDQTVPFPDFAFFLLRDEVSRKGSSYYPRV